MRSIDVIKQFIKRGNKCSFNNVKYVDDRLMYHNTVIAQFINGVMFFNRTKYSISCTNVQHELLKQINKSGDMFILRMVEGVEWDTETLDELLPA